MKENKQKRVEPYPDPPLERERLRYETYEYHHPFNYENIKVDRRCLRSADFHGLELNPVNSIINGPWEVHFAPDAIRIEESRPIVRVAVIGSACQGPGYVQVEAEPLSSFYRPEHVRSSTAVRYRIGGLWGRHLRRDQYLAGSGDEIKDLNGGSYADLENPGQAAPEDERPQWRLKAHYREFPDVGMSCAIFSIPRAYRVVVTGGSEVFGWQEDNFPDDIHYSFRIIRTTVLIDV